MKRHSLKLFAILLLGLTLFSCNETFEPQVDFGERTYKNDYSGLADQTKRLADKLDELNKILTEQESKVIVAIDGLTNALNFQTQQMSEQLSEVVKALFYGFTQIKTQIETSGNSIVYAINANGELIKLQLDASGKLISSSFISSAKEIADKIKDQTTDITAKLDALNTALTSGLLNIKTSIDLGDNSIKCELEDIAGALGDIDQTLLDGFKLVDESLDENGNKIVTAINNEGTVISAALDKNGNIIKLSIDDAAKKLADSLKNLQNVLENQNASLADKLDALNDALKNGLKDIKVQIGDLGTSINVDLSALKDLLGTKLDGILGGLNTISTKIDSNGDKIVTALTTEGNLIALRIDENGKLIGTAIDNESKALSDALKNLKTILENQNTSLADKLKALNDALTNGLNGVTAKIGDLNTTIDLDLGALKDLIGDKMDDLLKGLTTLSNKIDSNGDKIVAALNANGELIQLELKANGQIIKVDLVGKLDEILQALKSQSTSSQAVADKLDAINTVLTNGLATISAKIDLQTGKLELGFSDLSGKLGTIGTNLLNGFNTLNANLDKLVTAVGKVEIAIDNNTKAIVNLDANLKTELKALQDEIAKQGGSIVTAINGQGNTIALALGKDGELVKVLNLGVAELQDIEDAILKNGKSLGDLLSAGNKTAEDILTALGVSQAKMGDILAAIQANKVDLTPVITELQAANRTLSELLKISDGIYLNPADYNTTEKKYNFIYITTTVREAASKSTEVDEGLMSLLVGKAMNAPSKKQYASSTGTFTTDFSKSNYHTHSFWRMVKQSEPFLKYNDVVTDSDEKTLLKMEKYYAKSVWLVKIHDVCSFSHIYGIKVKDATKNYDLVYDDTACTAAQASNSTKWNKGLYTYKKGGTTYNLGGPIEVEFISYDKATDTFCEKPDAEVYSNYCGTGGVKSDCLFKDDYGSSGQIDDNLKDDGQWPEYNKAGTEKYTYLTDAK